jgi:photosystem II S4 domain protein
MLNKEKVLSHIKGEDERIQISKIIDKVQLVLKNYQVNVTDFIDPFIADLAEDILKGIDKISFVLDGGYPPAERKVILIYPDYLGDDHEERELCFLEIQGNFKFNEISHRDVLGSILGLGLKREKIGDILIINENDLVQGCYVIVKAEVADYLIYNLTKIHRVAVKVKKVTRDELQLTEEKVKEIFATVASLRLDAIASSGFGVSRSLIVKEIEAEKLKLNWRSNSNPAYPIKAGDIISLRGRGRLEVSEVMGKTSKDRFKVLLKKFL